MDNWIDILPSIFKMPYSIYKNKSSIHYWWKRMQGFLDKGSTNIVVVGKPASGKSVLISNLYGEVSDLTYNLPGTSTKVETKAIQLNEWTHLFRVIPGQSSQESFMGLTQSFNENKNLEGVIFVADYGFTTIRDEIGRKIMIKEKGIDTLEKLRKINLKQELDALKLIIDRIREQKVLNKGPKWFVIAVNKIDLYHDKLLEAEKYYHIEGNSSFSEALNLLQKELGKTNLSIVSLPVCAYEKDFDWNEEIIKTNIGGTRNKVAYLRNFMLKLSKLSK